MPGPPSRHTSYVYCVVYVLTPCPMMWSTCSATQLAWTSAKPCTILSQRVSPIGKLGRDILLRNAEYLQDRAGSLIARPRLFTLARDAKVRATSLLTQDSPTFQHVQSNADKCQGLAPAGVPGARVLSVVQVLCSCWWLRSYVHEFNDHSTPTDAIGASYPSSMRCETYAA